MRLMSWSWDRPGHARKTMGGPPERAGDPPTRRRRWHSAVRAPRHANDTRQHARAGRKASTRVPLESRVPARSAIRRIKLPGGREVKIHYEPGKPPWIESRLQDFFGMRESPRIGGAPVVVHLLAPNHRPVQVTSDLAGFWERLYPQVRKELSRRYPKHKWPEKPV